MPLSRLMQSIRDQQSQPRTSLSPEALHALLADTRRRRTIAALADAGAGTIVDVGDLVQELTRPPGSTDPGTAKTVLEHSHLPSLEEADVISWTRSEGTVTVGASIEALRVLLAVGDALASGTMRSIADQCDADDF